jgi:aminopeptidase N
VKPVRYAVALDVDPREARFRGQVTIEVDLQEATSHIVMHGRDLHVTRAVVKAGGQEQNAQVTARAPYGGTRPEELVLALPEKLPPGRATLEITYDAPFANDLAGIYRVQDGGRWYAFSQFEAMDARRAFPCFDEPGFKTPWDVRITVPRGMIAVSNAPERARDAASPEKTTFSFATTPPTPSYLIALAVGDLEVRPASGASLPLRLITTKGKSGLGTLALQTTDALVQRLGAYFDAKYPYDKLDIVAVPDFSAGAMENPGLITFREEYLLLDAERASTAQKRAQATVVAHELSHQWFGDLVTMEWWDDLWLNEGFATWMEGKVVDQYNSSYGTRLESIADAQRVMDTDALHSSRAVREPVRNAGEASGSFDGIAYKKGAAVLRMLERWLGESVFRKGVRDYIKKHAWKNVKADDLLKELDRASGIEVAKVAATFLERPGVPSLFVNVDCSKGTALELYQMPWRPLGAVTAGQSEGPAKPEAPWMVPVCMVVEGHNGKVCATVGRDRSTQRLESRCPSYVYPNADEAGYFRYALGERQLASLTRNLGKLDTENRIGLVANLWAQTRAGQVAPDVLLGTLPLLDRETNRYVVEQVIATLQGMSDALVDDPARTAFRQYVAARLSGQKRTLGWEPDGAKPETDEQALLRRSVLFAMGELAEDDATLREADRYARAWLKDPASVRGEIAQIALELSSRRAGEERLEALRAAAKGAKTQADRVLALRAMGGFDDPVVLRKALDLLLTPELKLSEHLHILRAAGAHRASRKVVYGWVKEHWDLLRTKLPGDRARGLVSTSAGLCTRADVEDARAFFPAHTAGLEGVKRPLDQALEAAGLCLALREHGSLAVTRYLSNNHKPALHADTKP